MIVTLEEPLQQWWTSCSSKLKTTQEPQEQTSGPSQTKRRCNTMCLCAIVSLNTHKNTQEVNIEIENMYKPNPNPELLSQCFSL